MSRRRQSDPETPPIQPAEADQRHNLGAQKDAIRDSFVKLYAIEQDIARAMETHIETLKQDRKDVWSGLKDAADMERTDLELAYKVYKRRREAKEFEDAEATGRVLDNLRTVFMALREGGQLDFLDAVTGGADADEAEGEREGRVAHGRGAARRDNPYAKDPFKTAWLRGWDQADAEWLKAGGGQTTPPGRPVEARAARF